MVLVVIVLVLMAMLGTAYVQVCRMDRLATAVLEGGNIDAVAQATLVYVGDVLRNDLVDKDRNFFNQISSANGSLQTGFDEPYDYPWTSVGLRTSAPLPTVTFSDGSTAPADGGAFDDTWLASITPDFETDVTKPRWKHVTNLNMIGLRIPKSGGSHSKPEPSNNGEYALIPSNAAPKTDTGLIITGDPAAMDDATSTDWEAYGADADGDGVPDSIWTWAPIRQISGVTYVMAVRIIDNSALINLNTAAMLHSQGQADLTGMSPDSRNLPRGLTTADVDLSRLLARGGVTAPTWLNEVTAFYTGSGRTMTLDGNGIVPTDPTGLNLATWPAAGSWNSGGRVGDFLDRIRLFFGYPTMSLSIQDELELRYRNGLNNPNTAYSIESLMPTLFRNGTTTEADYKTPVNAASLGSATDAERMMAYFQGASSANPSSAVEPIKDRTFPALRQMFTTRSGASLHAGNMFGSSTNYTNVSPTYRRSRFDLVHQWVTAPSANPTNRIDAIYDRIYNALRNGAAAPFAYLGINPGTQDWLLQQIAAEYAVAIVDYSDADLAPSAKTVPGVPGVNFYGLEKLPFLREAYVQAGYMEIDNMDAGGVAVGDAGYTVPDNTYDTWQVVAGSQAVIVEIGNPFDTAIDLGSGSMPQVRVAVVQGGTAVSTAGLNSTSLVLQPRDATGVNQEAEEAVLYSNPATPITEDGGTEGTTPLADLEVDTLVPAGQKAPVTLTYVADGSDLTLALQVQVTGGAWVTYDRLTVPGFAVQPSIAFLAPANWVGYVPGSPNVPAPRYRHFQQSLVRDGQNIRYLSNAGVATTARSPNTAAYAKRSASPIDKLWLDNKGVAGDTALDLVQLPLPNRPMLSLAELGHLFMVGFHDGANGDLPTRLTASAVAPFDTNSPRRWTLDVSSSAVVPGGLPSANLVPHAALLLDQFTTVSPRWDGVDNVNSDQDNVTTTGADTVKDLFLQGTINVNTAPLHVLALAVSMPEPIDDIETLMRRVVAYREADAAARAGMTGLAGVLRSNPGIAHLGELMYLNPGGGGTANDMQRYATDGSPENLTAGSPVDMYPAPEESTAARFDNVDGSAEAKFARFQFLCQMLSTRSDVFTAFIYIRGYPAGDFRGGPLEAKRLLAVFDRSGVVNGDETVQILGVYEFPN